MMQPGCDTCKHYRGGITCDAYPDFIPLPILAGDVPHFESLPGYDKIPDDGGIVYEPMDEMMDEEMKGGPGSGNWGHAGRPGHRGGSTGGGGHAALLDRYGYTARDSAPVEAEAPAGAKSFEVLSDNHPDYAAYEDRRAHADELRENGGWTMDTSEHVAQSFDKVKARVDDCPICVRVSPATMMKIADEGRFKTQFETGKSEGVMDNKFRARVEDDWMGAPKDTPPSERPIYGYVELSKIAGGNQGSEQYGSIVVKLKEEVRQRTTITGGDSLNTGLVPAPMSDAAGKNDLTMSAYRFSLSDPTDRSMYSKPGYEPKSNTDWAMANTHDYVETQIWGGVHHSDIAAVYDPEKRLSGPKVKQLQSMGLTVIQPKVGRSIKKETEAVEERIYSELRAQYPGQIISRKLGPDVAAKLDSIYTLKRQVTEDILNQRQAEMGEMPK